MSTKMMKNRNRSRFSYRINPNYGLRLHFGLFKEFHRKATTLNTNTNWGKKKYTKHYSCLEKHGSKVSECRIMPVMLFHPKNKSWWFIPKLHWFSAQFTHWFFGKTPKKINKLLLKVYTRQHFLQKWLYQLSFYAWSGLFTGAHFQQKKGSTFSAQNAKKVWNFFSSM